jgi:hypothetical protein
VRFLAVKNGYLILGLIGLHDSAIILVLPALATYLGKSELGRSGESLAYNLQAKNRPDPPRISLRKPKHPQEISLD